MKFICVPERVKGRPHIFLFIGVSGRFGVRLSLGHESVTVFTGKAHFLNLKVHELLELFA